MSSQGAARRAMGTIPNGDGDAYDAIVIGSGFGGSFAALPLVEAGARVLMIERGDWVPRASHNWEPHGTMELTPFYTLETPYRVVAGGQTPVIGQCGCVGGASVFYGGVSFRLRPADFELKPEIAGRDSGARWPIGYADLEPYYDRVEERLEVAGEAGRDPTEPPRRRPFPQSPLEPSPTSRMMEAAGRDLGLRPFPLPLAIHYGGGNGRNGCAACPTCDTFACAISAKNDLATCVLPDLMRKGLSLRTNTVAIRLVTRGRRIQEVQCVDRTSGRTLAVRGERVILAGGALASPHLLLASGLPALNPAGEAIGRHLIRHCCAIVFGAFPRLPDHGRHFQKQFGFHDFYFGHPSVAEPGGMLGSIQQIQTPPPALVKTHAPPLVAPLLLRVVPHATGLLVIAEDQPRPENAVALDRGRTDRFGLPQLVVHHRYTPRDLRARKALCRQARRILRRAGALFFYTHFIKTFSHAAGTVRFGDDPGSAPLDRFCRLRGVENLFVVDASFMPTVGGVNPSLTIAANALRVGDHIAGGSLPPPELPG